MRLTVILQGTGPWNLEARVVGSKGSETVRVENITTNRKTLRLPIPKSIDRDGGSFDIDLGMFKCLSGYL